MPSFIRFEKITADLGAPLVDGDGARDQYRDGYYLCANEAATSLRLRNGDNRSAMPILFLYRHYLEVALKDALDCSKVFDLSQSEKKCGHGLLVLWAEAKRVLGVFVTDEWLAPIEEAVVLFNAVDRRAAVQSN